MSTSASTVIALLERGAPDATALSAPGGVSAHLSILAQARVRHARRTQCPGHRQKRPHRDRARQWSGNGGCVPVRLRRCHRRAFEPGLSCRRVRVLSVRPEGQACSWSGATCRRPQSRWQAGSIFRSSGSSPRPQAARAVSPWNSRRDLQRGAPNNRARPRRKTSRSCCTPPAPHRDRRSCRFPSATSAPRRTT